MQQLTKNYIDKNMSSAIIKHTFLTDYNKSMLWYIGILLGLGVVMVASASFELVAGDSLHYTIRKVIYIMLSLGLAAAICLVPASTIFNRGGSLVFVSIILLLLVFLPVIGKEVNGSHRWLNFQFFTVQPAEFVKLFMIIFAADYIGRHFTRIPTHWLEFIKPLAVGTIVAGLLILQPDYGTAIVIITIMFGMLFLAPVRLRYFLPLTFVCGVALLLLMMIEPYRVERLLIFIDPWQDRYGIGFQLIESLIAIKNGGWFGVGLGDSIQKLSYLPEAHTDFILAIIAEELGIISICLLVLLFCFLTRCCFLIARKAYKRGFITYTFYAYGVGIWIFVQFLINAGVVLGGLPTKGITLPFVSAGGSSLIALILAVAILMRINYEVATSAFHSEDRMQYGR